MFGLLLLLYCIIFCCFFWILKLHVMIHEQFHQGVCFFFPLLLVRSIILHNYYLCQFFDVHNQAHFPFAMVSSSLILFCASTFCQSFCVVFVVVVACKHIFSHGITSLKQLLFYLKCLTFFFCFIFNEMICSVGICCFIAIYLNTSFDFLVFDKCV